MAIFRAGEAAKYRKGGRIVTWILVVIVILACLQITPFSFGLTFMSAAVMLAVGELSAWLLYVIVDGLSDPD